MTGVVASKRVTEASQGPLSTNGNRAESALAEAGLTGRHTSRAGGKPGQSDPVAHDGMAIAQRIKGTPGRGWSRFQGFGCSPIKVARELGSERRETVRSLSVAGVGTLRRTDLSTRGPGWTDRWFTGCGASCTAGYPSPVRISAESI